MIPPSRRLALSSSVIVILLAGCSSVAPTPGPSVLPLPSTAASIAPSLQPSPTVAPSPSVAASPSSVATGWRLDGLAAKNVATTFSDVLALPDGFLVSGENGPRGEIPVVLRSADGLIWSADTIGSTFAAPTQLRVVGDRVLAVGGGESDKCAHPSGLDTWARGSGGIWAETPFDPDFVCIGSGSSTLLGLGGKAVVLGSGSGDVPFLWTSTDGLHWVDGGRPFGEVFPQAAATDGTTLWVFGPEPDGRSVVISRTGDGAFGAPAPIPGLGPDASIQSAVWLNGALSLVVFEGGHVGILTSDGRGGWTAVPSSGGPSSDDVSRVESVDGLLVALGADPTAGPRIWTSATGTTWTAVAVPAEADADANLTGIAVGNGIAVAVGQVTSSDGTHAVAAIWAAPASILRG